MSDLTDTLTEGQKACLRLVAGGRSSKEIAIELGLSPQTVDTYVKVAMARLGVVNRREAARILAASELSQKSGSPSPDVVDDAPAPQTREATGGAGMFGMTLPPPIGGRTNTLGLAERSFAVFRVSVVGATVVIALALLIAGAFDAFR